MKTYLLAGVVALVAAAPAAAQADARARSGVSMTRADFQSRVQARFERADRNRDGFVTQDEVRAGARARLTPEQRAERRGERRAQLFARLDGNRDGVLSPQEFESRQATGGGDRAERRAFRAERGRHRAGAALRGRGGARFGLRAFAAVDANRDGRISLAEASARALRRFERLDANHDGRISAEERREAREMRQDRRARRGG